jgi:acyl-CoA synthetase (AMP-forming)/AMP-acid ligase II
MIHRELITHTGPFLSEPGRRLTYSETLQLADQLAAHNPSWANRKVGLYFSDGIDLVLHMLALDRLGADTFLFSPDMQPAEVAANIEELQIDFLLSNQPNLPKPTRQPASPSAESRVTLFTSGTSGKAKGALHTWTSLAAGIKRDARFKGTRWLLTYGLNRFAGLQVFLQCLLNGGCLVFGPAEASHLLTEQVQCISGTPTFWRKFLTLSSPEQVRDLPLKQITLGGEVVSQPILNALRAAFPNAQITHVYASTEMGVCFSVHDALEGFPASYLDRAGDATFRIENGELLIRSKRAMTRYLNARQEAGDWFHTGDLVELKGDRVLFLGRRSEIINVGGSKVYPAEIEDIIRKIPGISECRVFATKSSFAGNLVSAEIVPTPGADTAALKTSINAACEHLASHKRPRLITFVSALKENDSRKIVRSGT